MQTPWGEGLVFCLLPCWAIRANLLGLWAVQWCGSPAQKTPHLDLVCSHWLESLSKFYLLISVLLMKSDRSEVVPLPFPGLLASHTHGSLGDQQFMSGGGRTLAPVWVWEWAEIKLGTCAGWHPAAMPPCTGAPQLIQWATQQVKAPFPVPSACWGWPAVSWMTFSSQPEHDTSGMLKVSYFSTKTALFLAFWMWATPFHFVKGSRVYVSGSVNK